VIGNVTAGGQSALQWLSSPSASLGHNSLCSAQAPVAQYSNDVTVKNKKAKLSLTNLRDAKACQKLLQFNVLSTLSLTILVYLHSFSRCCV